MKRAAIVGAGFSGLSAAYFLSSRYQVTLFDQKGIGAGASALSSGLLHPYPGKYGRRSLYATEAIALAKQLIQIAANEVAAPVAHLGAILKKRGAILNPSSDVQLQEDGSYLISSGITVFPSLYLAGLFSACQKRGVELIISSINSLEELSHFDLVLVTAGAGIKDLIDIRPLNIGFVKGQLLVCLLDQPLSRSVAGFPYLAITEDPLRAHYGATYERDPVDSIPCRERAEALLKPTHPVIECRAAIRVTHRAHYFPILRRIDPKTWVITALGSRGLLYHAYLAEQLLAHLPY